MDTIYDFSHCVVTCILNHADFLMCFITGISIYIIYNQLKTSNMYNFLEIESKVIQLKNELDLLEKIENITSSNNEHNKMFIAANKLVDANMMFLYELNENTNKEINEKYKERLKINYYLAVDTMAHSLNEGNIDESFQNKHRDTIIEIYNKINDTSDAEQKFPNIMKFGKKHK